MFVLKLYFIKHITDITLKATF